VIPPESSFPFSKREPYEIIVIRTVTLTIRQTGVTQTIGHRSKPAGRPVLVTCKRRPGRRDQTPEAIHNLTGKTISHYRITGKIGSGGMGVVYRAKDTRLHRHVALKFLNGGRTNQPLYDRMLREARAASALNHPNVCTVYEMGDFQGQPFLVMELLEGQTLKERIKRPLTLETFLHIAIQICAGLDALHSRGIVHRDIKPSNIFVTAGDHVKIFDFSLAVRVSRIATTRDPRGRDKTQRLWCESGEILGTPVYMSPEHMAGEPVDSRTDLYSLGIVFDEMQLALGRETSSPLAQLIESALEGDRELRCQHAADLRAGLKRIQRDLQLSAIV
jgi:eukaryotic-like serine/threonine-protein kinase